MNDSPYQALVIRYGVLRTLIKQRDYNLERDIYSAMNRPGNGCSSRSSTKVRSTMMTYSILLRRLSSSVQKSTILISISSTVFELYNNSLDHLPDYYTWLDFFNRHSSIGRTTQVRANCPFI